MNTAEDDQRFAADVRRLKHAILEHGRRISRAVIASLLGSVAVGLGVWFGQSSGDRDGSQVTFTLGLAGATFFLGALLGRLLFPKPKADCPRCGCDWNAESEQDGARLFAWQRCPICGLRMQGDARERQDS